MKLSEVAKRMILAILVIGLLCIAGSIIYYRSLGFLPFLFGVLLGIAVSILKVFLLERVVQKISSLDKQQAKNHVIAQQMGSLALTAVVLVIGALVSQISLWGAAAGILAFHPAIYIANYKIGKSKETDSKTVTPGTDKTEIDNPKTCGIGNDSLYTDESGAANVEAGGTKTDESGTADADAGEQRIDN